MTAERLKQIETTKDKLRALAAVDPDKLARRELSTEINFADIVEPARVLLTLFTQLEQRDISRLTLDSLKQIEAQAERVTHMVNQIQSFSLKEGTPAANKDAIVNEWMTLYDPIMKHLMLPLAFTASQSSDYLRLEREAQGFHQRLKSELDGGMKTLAKGQSEAAAAIAAIKDQAGKMGVTSQAQIYEEAAKEHLIASDLWHTWTLTMSAITLVTAVVLLVVSYGIEISSVAASVQVVVSKLIVLSTLSLFTVWCAANYRAEKHNETVNKHRSNALRTFQTFIEGAADQRIKDAILLHAAQSAFSPRPTGFETSEQEPQHINPVVEILGKSIPAG
ncbi:MAG: hypothetical protein R3C20_12680 [Planctomycetaceae bacterium]